MICQNCYQAEYENASIEKVIELDETWKPINVEGMKCPACGDIVFTQEQSKAIDEERIKP